MTNDVPHWRDEIRRRADLAAQRVTAVALGAKAWPRVAAVLSVLAERFELRAIDDADEWLSRCPMHPHSGLDLSVYPDTVGRAVLDCRLGCFARAIAGSAQLESRDCVDPSDDIEHATENGLDAPRPRFKLLTDLELEQMPPIEFLVDGVLPIGGLGAIYGAPGAGKSFLALDMACSVAAGSPWLGRRTCAGSVVYVAAEGSAGLRQRLGAWKQQQGIVGVSLPLHFLTEPANLLSSSDLAALLLAIRAIGEPPALIIIDTLHRSMPGGDENSAKDVGLVIEHAAQLARLLGCAVLLVHHTAKGSDLERGSSSLRGAVDALLYAVKTDDGRRELRCEKAKDWAAFAPIGFELQTVDASCVVSIAENGQSFELEAFTPNMRQALTTLSRDFARHGATATEWLRASGLKDSHFYSARTLLVKRGYVIEPEAARGGRYKATESGRSAVTSHFFEASAKLSPYGPSSLSKLSPPSKGESNGSEARSPELELVADG